ncbi:MATH and LRR domain-containing protein PFE0570w-like [Chironomus tepperi]|uniref:MATH and LRR domain-containing protein PFE0570w-like n=1 Tax=Chironomus tepperi TaxID=113505 RepID=UPI00391F8A91
MRLNELFQVIVGIFLFAPMECGRTDHVHLKIHVPDIIHKHKHIKTKYVHVFHPKVVHTEIPEHSISYLHARNDPNIGLINGGYPQPLLNTGKKHQSEFRIDEEDFKKWRHEQQRKAVEKRRRLQQQYQPDDDDDDENVNNQEYDEHIEDEEQDINYEEDLYKKHKANKANSSALSSRKEKKKHRNHNYNQDYDSSNSDKVYANFPTRKSSNRPIRPSQRNPHDDSKKFQVYGTSNVDVESNVHQQFLNVDPTSLNPAYYSTLPKNAEVSRQDDIYSGLMSKKFNKNIADKSKLLADINYSRKQQTKNLLQKRKGQ